MKTPDELELFTFRYMIEYPSNLQQRVDYGERTDGNPVYIGYAPKGIAIGDNGWLIQKLTYETIGGNDYLSIRQISYDSWINRESATYA
jgi:hypothetical protein